MHSILKDAEKPLPPTTRERPYTETAYDPVIGMSLANLSKETAPAPGGSIVCDDIVRPPIH
jgi:hypothetical protein